MVVVGCAMLLENCSEGLTACVDKEPDCGEVGSADGLADCVTKELDCCAGLVDCAMGEAEGLADCAAELDCAVGLADCAIGEVD